MRLAHFRTQTLKFSETHLAEVQVRSVLQHDAGILRRMLLPGLADARVFLCDGEGHGRLVQDGMDAAEFRDGVLRIRENPRPGPGVVTQALVLVFLLRERFLEAVVVRMDEELQTLNGVGPTMSKMFIVSTQLMFPEKEILENECVVGTFSLSLSWNTKF